MRENGYYWVKLGGDSDGWVTAEYEGHCNRWSFINQWGEKYDGDDSHFHEINPQRILTPDEQAEKDDKARGEL